MDAKGSASEMTAPPPDLQRQYRRAWTIFLALFVLFTPVVLCAAVILFKLFGTFVPGFIFGGIWMAAWTVNGFWLVLLRRQIRRSTQL
jgi:hypothetical protein